MDEQGPEKQSEATDYDEKDNIKLPPPPVAAEKKKRITVDGLNKAINDIRDRKFPETLDWLGELATRLDKLEQMPIQDIVNVASDINARLKKLEEFNKHSARALELLLSNTKERNKQIDKLIQPKATVVIEEPAAAPQPAETEIESAQPPQQMAGGTVDLSGMIQWPNSCQTMNDILLVCRALKESPELTDTERKGILDTACKAAGVVFTQGLQIRAGVRNVEA